MVGGWWFVSTSASGTRFLLAARSWGPVWRVRARCAGGRGRVVEANGAKELAQESTQEAREASPRRRSREQKFTFCAPHVGPRQLWIPQSP